MNIREYIRDLLYSKERKLVQRNFSPKLLLSDAYHAELAENGYVLIPGVLTPEEISRFKALYDTIRSMPGFEPSNKFKNTFSYFDIGMKMFIRERTTAILDTIYPRVFDMRTSAYPMGAAYCISPPDPADFFNPHQDPALIDESVSYSTQTWIPLIDVTPDNGCLHVIPGSHRWGNSCRSVSTESSLRKFSRRLWEFAVPVPAKAGDMICFDVATMHCSTRNQGSVERIAVATHVVPKDIPMQTFYYSDEKQSDRLDRIEVDGDYFIEGHLYHRPDPKYRLLETMHPDNYFSFNNIRDLVREFAAEKARRPVS